MNYTEFLRELAVDLQDELNQRNRDTEVTIIDVEKPWDWQMGLQISDGRNVCPIVYPDKQYDYYRAGMNYQMIVDFLANDVENALDEIPEKHELDFMALKDNISIQLLNTERSSHYLEGKVHREVEDLSVIYRLNMELRDGKKGSCVVTEDMMRLMGLDEKELYDLAMENAPINSPYQIKSITEMLEEMTNEEVFPSCPLMVLTNDETIYGASVIMYPNVLEQCSAVMNGNFYIIPSSMHECLLQPDNENVSLEELKAIVEEVNDTLLSPEEFLSNNVYHYDWKEKVFEIADKYEARMKEKAKQSLLGNLESKKHDVARDNHLRWNQDIGCRRTQGGSLCL